MNPEDDLHKYEDHRNLKYEILTQYERDIMEKFHRFEQYRLLLMKRKIDITFLKICRDDYCQLCITNIQSK